MVKDVRLVLVTLLKRTSTAFIEKASVKTATTSQLAQWLNVNLKNLLK